MGECRGRAARLRAAVGGSAAISRAREGGMKLQGKVALVTGAAGGIGAATARLLASEGAHVICADLAQAGAK
ncbi:MAG: SDR family NAD(P)-dependent oxidoreductase, partial [Erythrobacteraceae bacterium]